MARAKIASSATMGLRYSNFGGSTHGCAAVAGLRIKKLHWIPEITSVPTKRKTTVEYVSMVAKVVRLVSVENRIPMAEYVSPEAIYNRTIKATAPGASPPKKNMMV